MISALLAKGAELSDGVTRGVNAAWNKVEKTAASPFQEVRGNQVENAWDKLEREDFIGQPKLPKTDGTWTGEPGDSTWKPNPEAIPKDRKGTNPENQTWGDILQEHEIDGIPFKDGEPDFSNVAKEKVEISDFTDDRNANFTQADEIAAAKWGCSPEEVKQWRQEHGYSWHEMSDCKTLELVPRKIHGNVPHSGGISRYKAEHAAA